MVLPTPSARRTVLCVDMDYFFAQCEERRYPDLQSRPVVVCVYSGRTPTSGVVSTANYVARDLGVKSGMPIIRAQKLLQDRADAVLLPVDHGYYEEVSARIMAILQVVADRFEPVSVDEAYLDITVRTQARLDAGVYVGRELKSHILSAEQLTCSVGVAPNKLLAKMAADFRKPDGLTLITPEQSSEFLEPLPVDRLYGVGPKSAERLRELDITTIGQLATTDVARLEKSFGRHLGRYLHRAARGVDDAPVGGREGREQISRITTLKENTRDPQAILPVLEQLARGVCAEAGHEALAFRSAGLLAFMEDLSVRTRSTTWERPVRDVTPLIAAARELLETLLEEVPDLQLRRVGLRVADLTSSAAERALTEFVGP